MQIKYIKKRIKELRAIYKKIEDEHKNNLTRFKYNKDSISAKEQVIRDENSSYICEVWGRLDELENLLSLKDEN